MREFLIFCSDPSGHYFNPIKNFKWTTTNYSLDDIVFYTDRKIMMPNKIGKKKIAWIFEPEEINQEVYNYIRTYYYEFDYVFTWDKTLCKLDNRFVFIPYGTSWIRQSDYQIYEKSKLVSLVASGKKQLGGHQLRHSIAEMFCENIDLYGRAYNAVDSLIIVFKDYAFTIVIENTNKDCNLSEKLITPLVCGTIPIYYGCPTVSEIFNINGLITFETVDDIKEILNTLSLERYQAMLPYVKENFEIAKEYQLVDDTLYNKLLELKII